MAIPLKLATDDTPEPWQSALSDPLELDYAREALPTARPPSIWRAVWRVTRSFLRGTGWMIREILTTAAFALLLVGTVMRLALAASAGLLFTMRRLSPVRLCRWLRYRDVPYAQVA